MQFRFLSIFVLDLYELSPFVLGNTCIPQGKTLILSQKHPWDCQWTGKLPKTYWNPFHYSLVESSHTRTWILIWLGIPIPNPKFRILIFSHHKIYLSSKYGFYGVLTLGYRIPCYEIYLLLIPPKYNYILGTKSTNSFFQLMVLSRKC